MSETLSRFALSDCCAIIMNMGLGHEPTEVYSEDDPPLKLGKTAELIPIDQFLGVYSLDKQQIIIFLRGIREASERLQAKPKHLEIIVRLHEWAHAVFHLGLSQDDRLKVLRDDSYWAIVLNEHTALFKEIEDDLHECLAQMLTLYCVQSLQRNSKTDQGKQILERVEQTFHQLSTRQPAKYRIEDLLDVPRTRILKSIALLRNRALVGKVAPWKTVVTW